MLKGIDPLLNGTLLHLLDELGHGDVLALVDRNFPAYRYERPVIELRGVTTAPAAEALLSVFPLDGFVKNSIQRMQIDNDPEHVSDPAQALRRIASLAEGRDVELSSMERFEFYEQAQEAMAFVLTAETVPYSCFLLRKGVV